MTKTASKTRLSRRTFLVSGTAAGGGLALGFHVPGIKDAIAQQLIGAQGSELGGAWVVIKPNEDVVIRIARSEMGQGTLTGLAQLVCEELECDWKKVS
jgi:isoquinoline 1-oxidoreductase beta subunit